MKNENSRLGLLNEFSIQAHCYPFFSLPNLLQDNNHHEKPYVCENCLYIFRRPETLRRHKHNGCFKYHKRPEYVPKEGIKFRSYDKLGQNPAKITMDEECHLVTEMIDIPSALHINGNVINPAHFVSDIRKIPHFHKYHVPYSLHIILHTEKKYLKYIPNNIGLTKFSKGAYALIKGDNCNDKLIRLLRKLDNTFIFSLKTINFPLHWSSKQREEFANATHCHICGRNFMNHPMNVFCSGLNYKS